MRILDHMANDLPTDRSAGQLSNAVDFISAHLRENLPISDYAAARREIKTNSMIAGVHAEGPYLSKKNRGAQPERYLRVP